MYTMAEHIVHTLLSRGWTISTAESCTGGLVASALVSVAGVSSVFSEGFITYSNEAKVRLLGVSQKTIEHYGAVSKECVSEMLNGLKSDVGIAVSGIAGPGGGTPEKPVGTVYIGVRLLDKTDIRLFRFGGERNTVRTAAATAAFDMLNTLMLALS